MTLKEFVYNYIVPYKGVPLYDFDFAVINSSVGEEYWKSFLDIEKMTESEIDALSLPAKYALAVSFLSHVRFQNLRICSWLGGVSNGIAGRLAENKELTRLAIVKLFRRGKVLLFHLPSGERKKKS